MSFNEGWRVSAFLEIPRNALGKSKWMFTNGTFVVGVGNTCEIVF